MSPSAARRRLATVLFLDIVGSTSLAAELGDARWRVVLARFRQLVRRELKRCGGREQDTAGDGFFATFDEPVQALRCAAAIVAGVQELGIDVRAGVHTGECEQIDGKLGGIAVHIGARVMSLGGAAAVVSTGTVRDLVAGSGARFDEFGTHELKGIEGTWILYRLRSIEVELPPPLAPDVAAARLASVTSHSRRLRGRPLAAGALALVVAAVAGVEIASHVGRAASGPPAMLRLDPAANRVASSVHDARLGCPCGPNLWAVNGTLWERTGPDGKSVSIRALRSGRLLRTFPLPISTAGFAVGFGAIWLDEPGIATNTTDPIGRIVRVDELSGRVLARIPVPGDLRNGTIAIGSSVVWVLDQDGTLFRIDPGTDRINGRFATGALETTILVPASGYEWICECINHDLLRYDAATRTAKTFHFAEQPWHLVGVDGPRSRTVWLLDGQGNTLTSVDPETGQPGQPIGLTGRPTQAVLARGSIWVAAGSVVDRIVLASGARTTITLPKGMNATGIAVDPVTDTVWVDNSLSAPVAGA
jgi:class 3 adenylate cyclase